MTARHALIFSVLLFFAFVPSAPADVLDELVRDFSPLSGYVVMPADGEFLIDRDAANGIAVGDLFSVVHPGKQIVHPVTDNVLGTLDRVKGFLQVRRIQSGYSHARPLEVKKEIVPGDVIRRFEHIPTAFLDTTGRGRPIFDRLRTALPGLEWKYATAAGAGVKPSLPDGAVLAFVLGIDGLEVRGPDRTLRSYEVPGEQRAALSPASTGPGKEGPKESGLSAGQGKSVGKAVSADFVVRGALPEGTLMADFVRDGDRLLLAATEGTRIEVFAVGDTLVPVAAGDARQDPGIEPERKGAFDRRAVVPDFHALYGSRSAVRLPDRGRPAGDRVRAKPHALRLPGDGASLRILPADGRKPVDADLRP